MPSAIEPTNSGKSLRTSRLQAGFERWNRKLHFYAGLFLLFFLWLFAFSGLLLNHSKWSSAQFWKTRKETNYEREIAAPGPQVKGDLAQARQMWLQLPKKRLPGAVALGLGSLVCGLFCVGLRWLF